MTTRINRIGVMLLIGISALSGCSRTSEPVTQAEVSGENETTAQDPHDIPLTDEETTALKQSVTSYANALAKFKSYRDTIRDAIAAGTPTMAHRSLDELDVVLEYLPTVARNNNIPKSQWENVNTSTQQIRESFNKLHAQIDGGEKVDYAAVAGDIDAALASLEGVQTEDSAGKL